MSLKRQNAMSVIDSYKISRQKNKFKNAAVKRAIKEEKKAMEKLNKAFDKYRQKKVKKELEKAFEKYLNQKGGFSKFYKKKK